MKPITIQIAHFSYSGVTEENLQSFLSLTDFAMRQQKIRLRYSRISGDALIERSRSRALSWILPDDAADVLVMIDHDIEFKPEDVYGLAIKALETDGLVGGIYSSRAFGKGWACRLVGEEVDRVEIGKNSLIPATYLGTGFLAIPRNVAIRLVETFAGAGVDSAMQITKCKDDPNFDAAGSPYFYDFFRCVPMPIEGHFGEYEFLSEDWAFCARSAKIGVPMNAWAKPVLRHWGMYGYEQKDARLDEDPSLSLLLRRDQPSERGFDVEACVGGARKHYLSCGRWGIDRLAAE